MVFQGKPFGRLVKVSLDFFTDQIGDDGIAAICSTLEKNSSMSARYLSL